VGAALLLPISTISNEVNSICSYTFLGIGSGPRQAKIVFRIRKNEEISP
jgi:hypothetical protein